jgi:hypothetical protein
MLLREGGGAPTPPAEETYSGEEALREFQLGIYFVMMRAAGIIFGELYKSI